MIRNFLGVFNPRAHELSPKMKYGLASASTLVATLALVVLLKNRGMLPHVGLSVPQGGLVAGVSGAAVASGVVFAAYLLAVPTATVKKKRPPPPRGKRNPPKKEDRGASKAEVSELKTIAYQGKPYVAWEEVEGYKKIEHGGKKVCLLQKDTKKSAVYRPSQKPYYIEEELFEKLPEGNYYLFALGRDETLATYAKLAEEIFKGEKAIPIRIGGKYSDTDHGNPVISWGQSGLALQPSANYIRSDGSAKKGLTNGVVAESARERVQEYLKSEKATYYSVTHEERTFVTWAWDAPRGYYKIERDGKTVYLLAKTETNSLCQIEQNLLKALAKGKYYLFLGSGRADTDLKNQKDKVTEIFGGEPARPIRVLGADKRGHQPVDTCITWVYAKSGQEYIYAEDAIGGTVTNLQEAGR